MSDDNLAGVWNRLRDLESAAQTPHDLDGVEQLYQQLMAAGPRLAALLVQHNQFRLRNATRLTSKRPKVLIGGLNDRVFPNFHTKPLLRVADVVSLTSQPGDAERIDRVFYRPLVDRMSDIIRRLPEGFTPDLFWDNQVEHCHLIPLGLDEAPFPAVAGLCHVFLAPSLVHLCHVFDAVAPVSRRFIPRIRSVGVGKVLDIPFGANWASFDSFIQPNWEKTIDVALTFADGPASVVYGNLRTRLVEETRAFQLKHGDRYSVVIRSGSRRDEYVSVLRQSRIVLNAVGINGPYNYRTCEAMNAGALLFQYDGPGLAIDTDIGDYFRPGEHLVTFRFDNLEEKLLYYLEHRQEAEKIARQGCDYLTSEYRYERVYRRLFRDVITDVRPNRPPRTPEESDFHVGMSYWHQPNEMPANALVALPFVLSQGPSHKFNNLMVMLPLLINVHGRQAILDCLRAEPAIAEAFRRDSWHGICWLFHSVPAAASHPVLRWNFMMLGLERGKGDREELERIKAELNTLGEPVPFDPATLLLHEKVRLPGMSAGECAEMWRRELAVPLLACDGSESAIISTYRHFMQWCCEHALGG